MRAHGADGTPSPSNRRLADLRRNLTNLRERLAAFDSHPGTESARRRRPLSGRSKGLWLLAEEEVEQAWRVLEDVEVLVRRAEEHLGWTDELADSVTEVSHAIVTVHHAIELADRIAEAPERRDRAQQVEDDAEDPDTAELARDLADRWDSDPLSQRDDELEQLERAGFDLALREARKTLDELGDACETIREAKGAIARFEPGELPSLEGLAAALATLEEDGRDLVDAAAEQQLEQWCAEAQRIGDAIFPTAAKAEALLRRHDLRRGHLRALEQKAVTLDVRERPDVDRLVSAIRDELSSSAPTDLERVEELLLRLGNLLNEVSPT